MQNRRNFIKLAASGIAFAGLAQKANAINSLFNPAPRKNYGLQLYTLRDIIGNDTREVLKKVASFGYKEIESYEGSKGIFWGMQPKEFKKLMDDLGMNLLSSHCDINKDFERKAHEASETGMRYLICPYLGPQKNIDDYKRAADNFNEKALICKKAGIRFAYHNHDYSFVPVNGIYPQDIMMQHTDPANMDYEMDIYWVVAAGEDPLHWMRKYPQRFKLGHVKDRKKNTPLSVKDASVILGTGSINFASLIPKASKLGMKHFIVEQELYEQAPPLEAAKQDATYLLRLSK